MAVQPELMQHVRSVELQLQGNSEIVEMMKDVATDELELVGYLAAALTALSEAQLEH